MSLPIIAYDNFMSDYSTITATSTATNYDAANITTWLPYEWWGPTVTGANDIDLTFATAQTANYIGIFSHNLTETSSTIELMYHNGSDWVSIVSGLDAFNSQVIFRTFSQIVATQWRIRVTAGTTLVRIGIVSLGSSTEVPTGLSSGFKPPHMSYDDKMLNNISDTGLLLGRSIISKSLIAQFQFNNLTPAWVRDFYQPFLQHARTSPFFISWDDGNYQDEAVFCITSGRIPAPSYKSTMYMSASLRCQAWHELKV